MHPFGTMAGVIRVNLIDPVLEHFFASDDCLPVSDDPAAIFLNFTGTLATRTGVILASLRKIIHTPFVSPWPRPEHMASTLILAKVHSH